MTDEKAEKIQELLDIAEDEEWEIYCLEEAECCSDCGRLICSCDEEP